MLAAFARPRTGAALALLCACAVGAARGGAHAARFATTVAATPSAEVVTRFDAVFVEPPRRESGEGVGIARVVAGRALPLGCRVRLRLPPGATPEWGDTVRVLARLERFEGRRVPGGFDPREAAAAARVALHGRAFTCRVRRARGFAHAPVALAMKLRRGMEGAIAATLSPEARELASPLLFGDRSAMSPETDARLRGSGLVHLLALSGLHVAWLAAVARGACAWAGGGIAARAWAGAACALLYAMLAGPIPSLLRTVAGETLGALARLTQRAGDPVQALAMGAAALLAWEPGWAGDLGFQLSVAATLGLVTLSRPLAEPFARWPRVHALVQPFATTLGAQLVALPLLLARFHALPWTGLLSNLAAVPLSELLLAAAWLGGALEAAAPGLGWPWLAACEPLARGIHAVARVSASWPRALLASGPDPAPVWLAAAGAALLALSLPEPRTIVARARRRTVAPIAAAIGGLLCACALIAVIAARPLAPPPGAWWLVAIDVGQGDALALCGRDGWWLVDAGPRSAHWDAGEGSVLPFLRWAGVRELRALVLTHDDGDHTGGARAVLRGTRVNAVFASAPRPGVAGPGRRYGARTLGRGDTLRIAPGARVFWPPRPDEAGEGIARRGDNAAALVFEAGEGRARALLMADADSVVEAAIPVAPGAAVLKAGHHGSGSSSGAAFVARALPARVLVSAGRRNAYGHPHPLALVRLGSRGAAIDRTDRSGTRWYVLDEHGARLVDWREGIAAQGPPQAPRAAPRPRP
ncbi:MAG: DNA internalization-related competence protein ComEC/Rec2 [Candidatus Eisenbacteria bacterium]|nr:DNA internalization-related competence protein ComEC/Rec2 [Candidatus Eisenbacteria bacterium]